MNIILYKDITISADLGVVSNLINNMNGGSSFKSSNLKFKPSVVPMIAPDIHNDLSKDIMDEVNNDNYGICFTQEPYDNNYFFESFTNIAIVSLYEWEQLTGLSINNVIVFFIAAVLGRLLPLGMTHDETTGCINDFWMDKTTIDAAMRSAYLCLQCKNNLQKIDNKNHNRNLYEQLVIILNKLSGASRRNADIVEYYNYKKEESEFDVFLCHNSEEKPEVKRVAKKLDKFGIKVWLDEHQLRPGFPWPVVLEEQISKIKSAAVFVGNSGIGPWQDIEIRAFLLEFIRRKCPVIPVILRDSKKIPKLPLFLKQFTWVDFRKDNDKAMNNLKWGITGKK